MNQVKQSNSNQNASETLDWIYWQHVNAYDVLVTSVKLLP